MQHGKFGKYNGISFSIVFQFQLMFAYQDIFFLINVLIFQINLIQKASHSLFGQLNGKSFMPMIVFAMNFIILVSNDLIIILVSMK